MYRVLRRHSLSLPFIPRDARDFRFFGARSATRLNSRWWWKGPPLKAGGVLWQVLSPPVVNDYGRRRHPSCCLHRSELPGFSPCKHVIVAQGGFNPGPTSPTLALHWTARPGWRVWQEAVRKWNESGFRPPLCTYRLNWARRTSWGWWDDWDDTVLQTQDSKFEPWRSEAEHATSRSRRLPTILTFTRGWGRNNFVSFKPPRPGTEPRTLAWKAAVLTTTLGPPPGSGAEQTGIRRTPPFTCCVHDVASSEKNSCEDLFYSARAKLLFYRQLLIIYVGRHGLPHLNISINNHVRLHIGIRNINWELTCHLAHISILHIR